MESKSLNASTTMELAKGKTVLYILLFPMLLVALQLLLHTTTFHGRLQNHRLILSSIARSDRDGESNSSQSTDSVNTKQPSTTKQILIYTTVYGMQLKTRNGSELYSTLARCRYNCTWSYDKTDINRSDAVLFHLYKLSPKYHGTGKGEFLIKNLPVRRDINQKWILLGREPSAFFSPQQLKLLYDMFNLTVTYMTDSDVRIPYGTSWKLSAEEVANTYHKRNYLSKIKTKMAFALISNCITSSRREDYVRELKKYVKVDVFGSCGKRLSSDISQSYIGNLQLTGSYKFYLAFENSDCDDYVSEKFWNCFKAGIIPVVRGQRVNYRKFAPPNSYIHADDYKTAQDLALYLREVASNSTLYNSYHTWRSTYGALTLITLHDLEWMCDLCEQVHTSPHKTVDVYEHFSEDTRCYTFDKNRNRAGEHMQDIEH